MLNDYDQETHDFFRWEVYYTQQEISALACRKFGIDFGDITDLTPIERGESGRIIRLKVTGSKRSMIIGKELVIRKAFSPTHLYSSAFIIRKEWKDGQLQGFRLKGAGWGHGVGLCQIGAAVMGGQRLYLPGNPPPLFPEGHFREKILIPMPTLKKDIRNPWLWVPTLYLAEGLPYIMVISISTVMYLDLQISNTDIAFYTSWLYLPWVIKPLWSPVADMFSTKRRWVLLMQLLIAISAGGIALSLTASHFLFYSLLFFWLLAFCSATHDIAADGFYMFGLNPRQQAYFVGIRTTFYRFATIVGVGSILLFSDLLQKHWNPAKSWTILYLCLTVLFLLFCIYHYYTLPYASSDHPHGKGNEIFKEFVSTFVVFFHKKHIGTALAFMLLYRLSESQLLKMVYPFLLDPKEKGGLALSASNVGLIYGSLGMIALTAGGIIGGILIARHGLKHWIGWMTLAINLPNFIYVYLAWFQPESLTLISSLLMVEQFGYGFGFSAYTFYLILFSEGEYKTAHYALCTGFMALGMMVPGMISGWICDTFGYPSFSSG